MRAIDRILGRVLKRFGRKIVDLHQPEYRYLEHSLRQLVSAGLAPGTIVDVGVFRHGTPALIQAFPHAKHLLIEPVEEFTDDIHAVYGHMHDYELISAAAAKTSGSAELSLTNGMTHSTLLDRVRLDPTQWDDTQTRTVRTVTLNEVASTRQLVSPYLIKIDIDSSEKDMEVLDGVTEILDDTDCIVLEANLGGFTGRPLTSMGSRLDRLDSLGFFAWDIAEPRFKEGVFFQCDLVFLSQRFRDRLEFVPWLDPKVLMRSPLF
jgi:FkbM family methyltransferase